MGAALCNCCNWVWCHCPECSRCGVSVWTWHPLKWDLLLLNVLMLPWHPLRSLTQNPIAAKWDIWYNYHHNQGLDSPFSIMREQQLKTDWFRHVLQTLVQLITVHVWRLYSVRLWCFLINISDVSAVVSCGPASLSPALPNILLANKWEVTDARRLCVEIGCNWLLLIILVHSVAAVQLRVQESVSAIQRLMTGVCMCVYLVKMNDIFNYIYLSLALSIQLKLQHCQTQWLLFGPLN